VRKPAGSSGGSTLQSADMALGAARNDRVRRLRLRAIRADFLVLTAPLRFKLQVVSLLKHARRPTPSPRPGPTLIGYLCRKPTGDRHFSGPLVERVYVVPARPIRAPSRAMSCSSRSRCT
jgi:hypothetical protein